MLNDQHIIAASLRWHTAHKRRLEAGAWLRKLRLANKGVRPLLQASDTDASRQLTEAKRAERAALKQLASLCEKVRASHRQADDAIEVLPRLN